MNTGAVGPRHTIVLIDLDSADVATFQNAALEERGTRVVVARTWLQGLALVRSEHPELVVAGAALAAGGPGPLGHAVREAAAEHAPALAVVVADDRAIDPAWPWSDAEALHHPIAATRARALIHSAIDRRATHAELADARNEVRRLTAVLDQGQDTLVELLLRIVELRLPGAGERTASRLVLARGLCERLAIPPALRRDLELATRLQELGYLAVTGHDPWRAVQSARAILDSIPGFERAAELLAGQCENWDGTGMPGHLQQGQIPLRSRILRVVLDYIAALEDPKAALADSSSVIDGMTERAGTWYDPMVMVHLRALANGHSGDDWHRTRVMVPAEDLRVGMVLAEDLYTDTGIKLLSQGTMISSATLETILRRHRADPLLHGAAVLRRSA